MTTLRLDTTSLIGRLNDYAAEHPGERLTVYLHSDAVLTAIENTLSLPQVVSVLLRHRNDILAAQYHGRLGWLDFPGNDHNYPTKIGDTFWIWDDVKPMGVNSTSAFRKKGIRRFAFATDLLATTAVVPSTDEIKRAQRYERHLDLRYKGKYGSVGAWLDRYMEEFRWKRVFHRLTSSLRHLPREGGSTEPSGILLVTNDLGAGGSERQLVNTALGLIRDTDENVEILCLYPDIGAFHGWRLANTGVQVSQLSPSLSEPVNKDIDAYLAGLRIDMEASSGIVETLVRLVAKFIKCKPRVVHAWLDSVNIIAGLAAVIAGVPCVILSARSLAPIHFSFLRPYMRPGYQWLTQRPNVRLLNNSRAGAHDYANWLGMGAGAITVIHNGVDLGDIAKVAQQNVELYRRKIGLAAGSPVVGGMFRFGEEKRPMLWARVAAEVARRRSDVQFLLVGDGPLRAEVRAFSEKEGFSDRLFMPGNEPNAALPLMLMSCFMLTSRVEGLPNVLLEAQAAGVPVVTSAVGGAPEATDHGRSGWVVKGDNPAHYADRILAILGNATWSADAAQLGRELVSRRFGFDRMISETLAVYRSPKHEQRSA